MRARWRAPGRDVRISPVRCGCPGAYFSVGTRHFRPLFLQRNFFLLHFRPFCVTFFSLAHFVTECVLQLFMAQWFPAIPFSEFGALRGAQQHEPRKTPRTSFNEVSSQRFTEQLGNAQESSLPCLWRRRNSGLKTRADDRRQRDKTWSVGTIGFVCETSKWSLQSSNLDLSGYTSELCHLCRVVSAKPKLRSAPSLTTCRRQLMALSSSIGYPARASHVVGTRELWDRALCL